MLNSGSKPFMLIAVLLALGGCGGSSSDGSPTEYANAKERAEAAFDASCRYSCEMSLKCHPEEFEYENAAECIEDRECGVPDTDSEEICEDEHTPDFYWTAVAILIECELEKMKTCDVWYPSEDASEEEHDYYSDNIYPCREESEAEDFAEEDWFETPEGQSMAEDCWGY